MNEQNKDKVTFSTTFEGELARKFDVIKRYYGLENNTEVVRILIHDKYKELFPKED